MPNPETQAMRHKSLATLKRKAQSATHARGHRMAWTLYLEEPRGPFLYAQCRNCGAYVQVLDKPRANEIEIGGTAVAINCAR